MAIVPGAGNCIKALFGPAIAPIGFESYVPRTGRRELTILAASTRRGVVYSMSALPPKADIVRHGGNVRLVPKADSCSAAIYATLRTGTA
jgi:hypothetical protein